MDHEMFAAYVDGRYKHQVEWYDNRAQANKKRYSLVQWAVIILAASLPVLISVAPTGVTIPMSVLLAIGTAALKTFKFQENWLSYRTVAESLKKERHYYAAGVGDYGVAEDKEGLFVERVENLISRENTQWLMAHAPDEENDRSKTKGKGSN